MGLGQPHMNLLEQGRSGEGRDRDQVNIIAAAERKISEARNLEQEAAALESEVLY